MSVSRPGYTERIGPPRTPPAPARKAPRQKTKVNRRETGMPIARAIGMSSTPARIIAPRRVRSISSQSDDCDPVLGERDRIDAQHAAQPSRRRQRLRIAGPDHEAAISQDERDAEGGEHLR